MKRQISLLAALTLALGGWIAAGALTTEPYRAEAQSPPVEIHRVADAAYTPTAGNQPIFILALGSDARPGEQVDARLADSIHLIGINPKKRGATILGFPRDSFVSIPGVGERKINEGLFNGGPELMVETIESLTGIQIDYYLLTSFEGMKKLVNGIGGVRVEVPYAMNDAASGAVFDAGPQELDGADALAFSRNRKDTPNGDFSRSENQGILLTAALQELRKDYRADPTVIFRWIATGLANVQTDLGFDEVFDLMLTAVQIEPNKVTNLVVPGGTGTVGGASVVILSGEAPAIYADLADDGLLESSG